MRRVPWPPCNHCHLLTGHYSGANLRFVCAGCHQHAAHGIRGEACCLISAVRMNESITSFHLLVPAQSLVSIAMQLCFSVLPCPAHEACRTIS